MDKVSMQLLDAMELGEVFSEQVLRDRLRQLEAKDPELVYLLALTEVEEARRQGKVDNEAEERARAARGCLPQFNLDGLWIGKYGSYGYELINITYVGDLLIATKVTGDRNVPKGEITFQADLYPIRHSQYPGSNSEALKPIDLTNAAAQKWSTRKLLRYSGLGQVSEENFVNNQWMNGQLIIIGDQYFSFAWIPIEQQIFFGRPSPELALKMLRENGLSTVRSETKFQTPPSLDANIMVQKDYATKCLDVTDECYDDVHGCIWYSEDYSEECILQ